MLAHGPVSSGLFAGVNINNDQTHSRSLVVNKGILRNAPDLTSVADLNPNPDPSFFSRNRIRNFCS
jgi:hypothetical protein